MTRPADVGPAGARGKRAPLRAYTQRGAATAETAAVLPILTATLILLVWMVSLAVTQIRVVDAAREAARVAARSDAEQLAVAAARKVAPPGADVAVRYDGPDVAVTVQLKVAGPGGMFAFLPLPSARATAISAREDR